VVGFRHERTNFSISPFQLTATFLGNSSGNVSGADVLTIDSSQNFEFTGSGGGQAHEQANGTFGGPLAQAAATPRFSFPERHGAAVACPYTPTGAIFSSRLPISISLVSKTRRWPITIHLSFGRLEAGAFVIVGTVPINVAPLIPLAASCRLQFLDDRAARRMDFHLRNESLGGHQHVEWGFSESLGGVSVTSTANQLISGS